MKPDEIDLDLIDVNQLQDSDFVLQLEKWINKLILENFEKLVTLLYRIDVSEQLLKKLLATNPGSDAGHIIARLIIDRQLQKIKSRDEFRTEEDAASDEERW